MSNIKKSKIPKHTQKYEPDTESETEPMSDMVKFQTLKLNQEYVVSNYSLPKTFEYGMYCTLKVSEAGSEESFEMFSTPLLMKYIEDKQPKEPFNFTVKIASKGKAKGKKCAFIEGYRQETKWVLSE